MAQNIPDDITTDDVLDAIKVYSDGSAYSRLRGFAGVEFLQYGEGLLACAILADEPLPVPAVLYLRQRPARRTEVAQDPGSHAAELRDFFQHRQRLAIKVGLEFLGEASAPVAVHALQGVAAKFADNNGLVVIDDPLRLRAIIGYPDIPADVLVETDQVGYLGERVLDNIRARIFRRGVALHGGRDQASRVEGPGVGHEFFQEDGARRGYGRLVGHGPDDDAGAVAVAGDQFCQLILRVGIGGRVVPMNRPVDGHFRPEQNAHLVGDAGHVLVVRIMREADVVAAELAGPAQKLTRIRGGRGPTAAQGILLVQTDAAQENGFAVQEDVRPARLDGAEANLLCEMIRAGRERDLVEPGMLGSPELGPGQYKFKRSATGRVRRDFDREMERGDFNFHRLLQRRAGELDITAHPVVGAWLQLEGIVADAGRGSFQQHDITGKSAVVPPVGVDGGHRLGGALVIDADHEGIAGRAQFAGDLKLEGSEAADVLAQLLAVQVDIRRIICAAEVEKLPGGRRRRREVKLSAIPDGVLVIEQLFLLRIPVTGHVERRAAVEIVLDQFARVCWLAIEEVAAGRLGGRIKRLEPIVEVAVVVGIDDDLPAAIQGQSLARGGVAERGFRHCDRPDK